MKVLRWLRAVLTLPKAGPAVPECLGCYGTGYDASGWRCECTEVRS